MKTLVKNIIGFFSKLSKNENIGLYIFICFGALLFVALAPILLDIIIRVIIPIWCSSVSHLIK